MSKKHLSSFLSCHNITIFFAILCIYSCKNTNSEYKDITDYYYPIEQLQKGLIYEYLSIDSSFSNEYIFIQGVKNKEFFFLHSILYDINYKISQLSIEKFVSNGSKLESIHFFNYDSTGSKLPTVDGIIEYGNFFPFQVKDSLGIFLSSIVIPKTDSTYYRVIRNKKYIKSGFYTFEKQKLETITLSIKQLVEDHEQGVLETKISETQTYAKGIGLVSFEKYFSKKFRLKYILNKRYTKSAFLKEKGISLLTRRILNSNEK